jgi:hypothetical protein
LYDKSIPDVTTSHFIQTPFRVTLIAQMFVAAMSLTAFIVLPGVPAALVISACAAGGAWILREQEAPATRETAKAVKRSRTVIGELDDRARGRASL